MRVLRIENDKGDGCYSVCVDYFLHGADYPGTWERHPAPENDPGLRNTWAGMPQSKRAEFIFGFYDESQMNLWFDQRQLRALDANELRMAEYEVGSDDVVFGKHQLIFRRDSASLIRRQPLLERMEA